MPCTHNCKQGRACACDCEPDVVGHDWMDGLERECIRSWVRIWVASVALAALIALLYA